MTTENQNIAIEEWLNHSEIVDLGETIHGVRVWGEQTNRVFQQTLLRWYQKNKRRLPWRENTDAYRVWVSEIMLQQTQVDTVIPYYNRFMEMFPTIATLAEASESTLMKAWEGLGYYSRVRNMQTAAQQIMSDFNGEFPQNYTDILSLKGIGPYTAGAIGSIAFGLPKPAVDGNAMRVYSRLFGITADIAKAKNRKLFEAIGEYLIAKDHPGDFNQAIMDLGSQIESAKAPTPEASPIAGFTLATLTGKTLDYPVKTKAKKQKVLYYDALILQNQQEDVFIVQREKEKLLAQLWTVPLLLRKETQAEEEWQTVVNETEANYAISPILVKQAIGTVKHIFSHQIWHITIYHGYLSPAEEEKLQRQVEKESGKDWTSVYDLNHHAYPTVQMKIWEVYREYLKKG